MLHNTAITANARETVKCAKRPAAYSKGSWCLGGFPWWLTITDFVVIHVLRSSHNRTCSLKNVFLNGACPCTCEDGRRHPPPYMYIDDNFGPSMSVIISGHTPSCVDQYQLVHLHVDLAPVCEHACYSTH